MSEAAAIEVGDAPVKKPQTRFTVDSASPSMPRADLFSPRTHKAQWHRKVDMVPVDVENGVAPPSVEARAEQLALDHTAENGHFLGSLYGNQEHQELQHIKAKYLRKKYTWWQILLGLPEVRSPSLYRAAYIEGCSSFFVIFVHLCIVNATLVRNGDHMPTLPDGSNVFPDLASKAKAEGNYAPWAYGAYLSPGIPFAVFHGLMVMLVMLATGVASGAHFIPTVTFPTVLTGHTSVIRGCLYITCQIAGSVLGAMMYREAIGWDTANQYSMAICEVPDGLSTGAAFAAEFVLVGFVLYIAYGIALDPRQGQIVGPIAGPIFIGLLFSLVTTLFLGVSHIPGLTVTFCLGPAVAYNAEPGSDFGFNSALWISVVAPACASVWIAITYMIAPPHHAEVGFYTPPLLMGTAAAEAEENALKEASKVSSEGTRTMRI